MNKELKDYLERTYGIKVDENFKIEDIPVECRALVTPGTLNTEERSIEVIIATENPVLMPDFKRMEMVEEIILMSGIEVRGGEDKIKFLEDHNQEVRSVIGSIVDLRVEGDKFVGRAIFSESEETLFIKASEGHLDKISAGYRGLDVDYVEPGQSKVINGRTFTASNRPLRILKRTELYEGSLVVIPADLVCESRSYKATPKFLPIDNPKGDDSKMKMNPQIRKLLIGFGMPDNATEEEALSFLESDEAKRGFAQLKSPVKDDKTEDQTDDDQTDDEKQLRYLKEDAERLLADLNKEKSQDEIRSIFKPFENRGEKLIEVRDKCLEDGVSVEQARKALTDELANDDQSAGRGRIYNIPGQDERDHFRRNASLAIERRSGRQLEGDDIQRANAGHTRTLLNLAERCLDIAGVDHYSMDRMTLVGRALATTSDFPNILENTVHKVLLDSYGDAIQTWRMWCGIMNLTDFNPHSIAQLSQSGVFPEVPEGAPIPHKGPSDHKESIVLKTYGEQFSITCQAIINDDLNAFNRIPTMHSRAWARTINQLAVKKVIANGALSDGFALFSTDHSNISTGTAPSSIENVRTIIQNLTTLMRKQKDLNGESFLNLSPFVVLGHSDYEFNIKGALNETDRSDNNTPNALRSLNLGIALEPELVDSGDVALDQLFVFANPMDAPVVTMGFLDGNDAPRLDQKEGWSVEGVTYKVAGDVAAGVSDYRGAAKSTS